MSPQWGSMTTEFRCHHRTAVNGVVDPLPCAQFPTHLIVWDARMPTGLHKQSLACDTHTDALLSEELTKPVPAIRAVHDWSPETWPTLAEQLYQAYLSEGIL